MGANQGGAGLPVAIRTRLNNGAAACTDGTNVYYDDRLNEIQRKCAIVHELIHVERQHSTVQPEHIETQVRYETARRLLPVLTFGAICANPGVPLGKSARQLGVTRQVLMDRAATLNDAGAAAVGCEACQKCPSMAARFDTSMPPSVDDWEDRVLWA